MKRFPIVLTVIALGAAGFAAASIASGGRLVHMLTGTDATVTTPTVTTATTTTGQEGGRRVTMCHHTGSKKHPFHTITVDQHAVKAHMRHHDTLGACPPVAPTTTTTKSSDDNKHGNKGKGKSNDQHGKPVVAPTTPTTTTTSGDDSNDSSHGNSGNHGNSGDHGNGHGHGKP